MTTKQDIISRTMSAVMHILHDSHLFGSDLWPEHGFKAGYGNDIFTHDEVYVAAKIWNYPLHKEDDQWVIINMHSLIAKRIKQQGAEIDLILEDAIYDDVLFKIWSNPKVPPDTNRYYLTGPGGGDNHGLQLIYTFTIND